MSPTVFRKDKYRFFFFSREEIRMHVHVSHPDGEAKFWLEPQIALETQSGLSSKQIKTIETLIHENLHDVQTAWKAHFQS